MEKSEILTTLISTGITALSVILIYLTQFLIKKITKSKDKQSQLTISEITSKILEAEQKLGKGQGKAKLLYVLSKLNKKETDKKAIKKINEAHAILKTAKNSIIENPTILKGE